MLTRKKIKINITVNLKDLSLHSKSKNICEWHYVFSYNYEIEPKLNKCVKIRIDKPLN